ncbi:MAG: sugar ABC transporter permease [Oscillospiraceae bacterium]|nr:sugar ABC transporter permease [Oscillospiraceae bacterium]MBQ4544396.1 sugar ABC transporter permease [Oscillospiraceae bacterium]MBQ6901505.1 sugar ABC transporter permease [Oscillospiraceae bacterium]
MCKENFKELNTLRATKNAAAEVLPNSPASAKPEWLKKLSDGKYLLMLVLPSVICLALFYYFPMYGLVIAFKDYKPFIGLWESEWVGFENFIRFFNYKYAWRMIRNTFLLSFWSLLWGFPAPIILALVLNEVQNMKFKKFVQTISYMPHFFSTVIVVGLVTMLLSPTGGLITKALESIGIEATNILADARYFRTIYIASGIWQELGWGAIVYLAALTNVDPQLYEAATIDGAGKMRCLWSITLPSIAPTIITMLLLRMGSLFNVGFEKAFLLQSPSTYETSEIIATYVYTQGLQSNSFSYGTAVGLFNSIVSLALVIIGNYVSKTVSETSLW